MAHSCRSRPLPLPLPLPAPLPAPLPFDASAAADSGVVFFCNLGGDLGADFGADFGGDMRGELGGGDLDLVAFGGDDGQPLQSTPEQRLGSLVMGENFRTMAQPVAFVNALFARFMHPVPGEPFQGGLGR